MNIEYLLRAITFIVVTATIFMVVLKLGLAKAQDTVSSEHRFSKDLFKDFDTTPVDRELVTKVILDSVAKQLTEDMGSDRYKDRHLVLYLKWVK